LIEIGSKTAEKNSAQTDKQTDTMKIMVTWPWTNKGSLLIIVIYSSPQPLYIPPCCRGHQSYLLVVFACSYGSLKEDVGTLSGAADHGSVWVQCELMQVLLHFLMRKQLCNVFIWNHLYTHTEPC